MPCVHELSLYLGAELGDAAEVIGMNAGGTVETHGLRVTMVPAVHSSGDLMGGERVQYFGEPIGFVISSRTGSASTTRATTTAFGDMALIRELYKPDLAILPIGGHFTMDPAAAAVAVGLLGVPDVLPVHWGMFPILTGTPAALVAELTARGVEANVVDWKPGDRRTDRPGIVGPGPRCPMAIPKGAARGSARADERVRRTPSRASAERPDGSRTRRPASQSWLTPGCMLWTITRSVSIEPGSATDTIATPSCSCTAGMSASV